MSESFKEMVKNKAASNKTKSFAETFADYHGEWEMVDDMDDTFLKKYGKPMGDSLTDLKDISRKKIKIKVCIFFSLVFRKPQIVDTVVSETAN